MNKIIPWIKIIITLHTTGTKLWTKIIPWIKNSVILHTTGTKLWNTSRITKIIPWIKTIITLLISFIYLLLYFIGTPISLNIAAHFLIIYFVVDSCIMWCQIRRYDRLLIIHHAASIALVSWGIWTQVYLKYMGVYLIVEINTAFLHLSRKIPESKLIRIINYSTWVFFRLIIFPIITYIVHQNPYHFHPFTQIFIMTNQCILLTLYLYWSFLLYKKSLR